MSSFSANIFTAVLTSSKLLLRLKQAKSASSLPLRLFTNIYKAEMPSKRLFQNSEESDLMVADICQLNLDSTPVKPDDIISFVVTPNVKRSLFLEPDENSD
jgi:hypothetical protein